MIILPRFCCLFFTLMLAQGKISGQLINDEAVSEEKREKMERRLEKLQEATTAAKNRDISEQSTPDLVSAIIKAQFFDEVATEFSELSIRSKKQIQEAVDDYMENSPKTIGWIYHGLLISDLVNAEFKTQIAERFLFAEENKGSIT